MHNEFNKQAKEWDTPKRVKRAQNIAKQIKLELSETNKNMSECTVLEFGCGTGLISFNLYEDFKKVVMVDSSSEMIKILQEKIKEHKVQNMQPLLVDLSKDDEILEKVDIIYTSMVLHHIQDISDILATFYKLLNPNGYLIIIDLDKEDGRFHLEHEGFDGHNGFIQEELKTEMKQVGYKDVKSYTFFKGVKEVKGEDIYYSLFIMVGKK